MKVEGEAALEEPVALSYALGIGVEEGNQLAASWEKLSLSLL